MTTLESIEKALQTGFTAVAEDIADMKSEMANMKFEMADMKSEMIDQFEHFDKRLNKVEERFNDSDGRLLEIVRELGAVHRKVDRLEDQGASTAGFAKEIDVLMSRIGLLEKEVARLSAK